MADIAFGQCFGQMLPALYILDVLIVSSGAVSAILPHWSTHYHTIYTWLIGSKQISLLLLVAIRSGEAMVYFGEPETA